MIGSSNGLAEKKKMSKTSKNTVIMERPLSSASKRSKSSTSHIMGRSATAFELHAHFPHRGIYPTFSSGYAMRQKFFTTASRAGGGEDLARARPMSSVNFMRRSNTTAFMIRAASRKRLYDRETGKTPKDEIFEEEEELLMPKRSVWILMRLAMVYFGIEVLFSLETALAIPILLKLKVPEK